MCRNIKPLYNFEPPATPEEIYAAAEQFVRKISGMNRPSQANQAAFQAAIQAIASASTTLLNTLETRATARDRQQEAEKARRRTRQRFPSPGTEEQ